MKRAVLGLAMAAALAGGGAVAAPLNINFDGNPLDDGIAQSGLSTFSVQGAHWSGGMITEAPSALRASGSTVYAMQSGEGKVMFDQPVMNVSFFFVHGEGVPAGMAMAYSADGRVLDTQRSRAASHSGDSRNFVRFETKQPISAVVFSGGAVDNFRAEAFSPDYFLVQGHSWVNDDVPENNAAGIFFDYISSQDTLFMAWYTYDSAEKTDTAFDGDVGAADNRWLTARFDVSQGENPVIGTLYASSGGEFNQPRNAFQETVAVGTVELEFIDCDRAMVTYDLDEGGLSNTFAIIPTEKQLNPEGFRCDPSEDLVQVFQPDLSQVDADIELAIRAAYDDENVAIQFSWATNKNYFGLLHDIRSLNEEGEWSAPEANLLPDDPTRVFEDRVHIIWEAEGASTAAESPYFGCFQSCHADMNEMPENIGEDTRHYVIPGDLEELGTYQADMWHWRGARGGPMGYAEDTWVRAHEFGTGAQGRRRDETGSDGRLRENQGFGDEYTATVNGESVTVRLPEFVYDPALNSGFYFLNDGERLITEATIGNLFNSQTIEAMEAGERQHALIVSGPRANTLAVADLDQDAIDAIAAEALAGAIINRPFLQDDLTGDSSQHDIRSNREFSNGQVTVTMIRALDTGFADDIALTDLATSMYWFGAAVHDGNLGRVTHHVSVPLSIGPDGNVEPVAVDSVETADWTGIPAYTTTVFKPGDMSYQWLKDVPNGHPVEVDASCASCHSINPDDHPFPVSAGTCLGCHAEGGTPPENPGLQLQNYAPLNLRD